MATVPVLERSVLPAVVGPVTLSPSADIGAFGGRSAQSLVDVGGQIIKASNEISDAMLAIEQEDNEREFKRLEIELSRYLRTVQFGDGTEANPGYLATQGENAINQFKTVDEGIKNKLKELRKSASNGKVREMFNLAAEERVSRVNNDMLVHVTTQRNKANDDLAEARINEAISDASANWSDNNILKRSLIVGDLEINQMGKRNGWGEEIVASKKQELRSKLLRATIEAAITGNNGYAKKLLATYSNQLDGVTKATLEEQIQAKTRQQISDAERYNRLQEEAKRQEQDALYSNMIVRAAKGELSEDEIISQLSATSITPQQYFSILSYNREELSEGGNEDHALQRKIDILLGKGDPTFGSIVNDSQLDKSQKNALIELQTEVNRNGGPLANDVVKRAQSDIEIAVAGPKNILGEYADPADAQRVSNALNEFNTRYLSGETDINKLKADVIEGYLSVMDKQAPVRLQTMRTPKFWSGILNNNKENLLAFEQDARLKTAQALKDGKITEAEALREFRLLEEYRNIINTMPNSSTKVTQ